MRKGFDINETTHNKLLCCLITGVFITHISYQYKSVRHL
ncbi:hypothetical protein 04086_4566 [Escherichia phage 04086]|nr:hypothetical protein 04086_4566 [Escherichia phage 04086]